MGMRDNVKLAEGLLTTNVRKLFLQVLEKHVFYKNTLTLLVCDYDIVQ